MQHDTSPHRASIAGVEQRVETASLVLCYSRMLFFQAYPVFTRFYCKVFLTDALTYLGASAATCMIDNTHVVVAAGTGARMIPAPEMAAFAERFNFTFRAHEKGDANRSARVERPFHFIEHNFLAGRTFADLADLNAQARAWCDKVNASYKDHLHASPRELFAAERPHLRPLPPFIPEVYALHHRLVDVEGYINVHGHRSARARVSNRRPKRTSWRRPSRRCRRGESWSQPVPESTRSHVPAIRDLGAVSQEPDKTSHGRSPVQRSLNALGTNHWCRRSIQNDKRQPARTQLLDGHALGIRRSRLSADPQASDGPLDSLDVA